MYSDKLPSMAGYFWKCDYNFIIFSSYNKFDYLLNDECKTIDSKQDRPKEYDTFHLQVEGFVTMFSLKKKIENVCLTLEFFFLLRKVNLLN